MLLVSVRSAKPLCVSSTSHVTVKMGHLWETGPSNKPVGTWMNDAWTKGLNDFRP